MKWVKRALVAFILVLALAALLPFLITLNDYIPLIEKEASQRLQAPVTIKSIHFIALPRPHLTIDGIAVGSPALITIGKVRVTPDLYSLMHTPRVIESIEVDSLYLGAGAISRIPVWAGKGATGSAEQAQIARIKRVLLRNAKVSLGKIDFGPLDARVDLDSQTLPENISIATQDGKIKAQIRAEKSVYQVDASAKAWAMPTGPALLFDELNVRAKVTGTEAQLGDVRARLYGGRIAGKVNVGWQKGLRVSGSLDVTQLELQKVVPLFSPATHLSGRLDAKPVFSTSAASADKLMDGLRLDTPFNIKDGVLGGVDIQKATSTLSKDGASGGETRFEQLAGNLAMDQDGYHFTQLKITSGSLSVDGNVDVSKDQKLAGRINAQLTGVNVPLTVTGTVDKPSLFPTGATMTGAAIGTFILGPGVGTSVGAKVGGWLDNMFSGKKEGKQEKKKAVKK